MMPGLFRRQPSSKDSRSANAGMEEVQEKEPLVPDGNERWYLDVTDRITAQFKDSYRGGRFGPQGPEILIAKTMSVFAKNTDGNLHRRWDTFVNSGKGRQTGGNRLEQQFVRKSIIEMNRSYIEEGLHIDEEKAEMYEEARLKLLRSYINAAARDTKHTLLFNAPEPYRLLRKLANMIYDGLQICGKMV